MSDTPDPDLLIDPDNMDQMHALAGAVDAALPPGYKFTLLVTRINDDGIGDTLYLSSLPRRDAMIVLKELIEQAGSSEH